MEKALIQWKSNWKKHFQNVRLKWIHELSPELLHFFKDIEWTFGEMDRFGDYSYILYFKSMDKIWELTIKYEYGEHLEMFYIKEKNTRNYPLDYAYRNLNFKQPFTTKKEAELVFLFFKELGQEIRKTAQECSIERKDKEKMNFTKEMNEITVLSYDDVREELHLSNGKVLFVGHMFEEIESENKEKRIHGKSS